MQKMGKKNFFNFQFLWFWHKALKRPKTESLIIKIKWIKESRTLLRFWCRFTTRRKPILKKSMLLYLQENSKNSKVCWYTQDRSNFVWSEYLINIFSRFVGPSLFSFAPFRNIIKDLDDSLLTIDALVEKLQTILLQIHDVVRYRVAIATVQVFPLFLELSNVWVEMQEQVDILSEINNNLMDLSSVSKVRWRFSSAIDFFKNWHVCGILKFFHKLFSVC